MNNYKEEDKNQNKPKDKMQDSKQEQDSSVKITITKEAGQCLSELVDLANDGFDGGRINRQSLASFIIEKFKASHSEADLIQLRQSQYDDMAMLEAMYRKMKDTGKMPDFLRDALRRQFQIVGDAPKKQKKGLTKEHINDVLTKSEEAA